MFDIEAFDEKSENTETGKDRLTGDFYAGDSFYTVQKHLGGGFEFCCPGIEAVLGFAPAEMTPQLIRARIHPADCLTYNEHDHVIAEFFNALPFGKRAKYKVRRDFRLRHKSGCDVRVVKQTILSHRDENHRTFDLIELYTDITHLKTANDMTLSIIGLRGEPSYHNIQMPKHPSLSLLSKREREILGLICDRHTSRKIAEMLNLSRHTVNNHRKNILRKTGSGDFYGKIFRQEKE